MVWNSLDPFLISQNHLPECFVITCFSKFPLVWKNIGQRSHSRTFAGLIPWTFALCRSSINALQICSLQKSHFILSWTLFLCHFSADSIAKLLVQRSQWNGVFFSWSRRICIFNFWGCISLSQKGHFFDFFLGLVAYIFWKNELKRVQKYCLHRFLFSVGMSVVLLIVSNFIIISWYFWLES